MMPEGFLIPRLTQKKKIVIELRENHCSTKCNIDSIVRNEKAQT